MNMHLVISELNRIGYEAGSGVPATLTINEPGAPYPFKLTFTTDHGFREQVVRGDGIEDIFREAWNIIRGTNVVSRRPSSYSRVRR